ncbi:hypothetical protein OIDMADRAFT_20751 [Oidiodendron maius Zn]|uniref:Uncharacterized protein n=1 Tax=Oidiodendron maius (strain Zn) TaxID=913774 RepID=A0A0C3GYT1_OIDMZ|nr:hypothetical protein OIDMADRAFT_20751 [Oidiodendron maius Zn]
MDPDFCNGYDEHVAQFPATGKINVENHFSNDPQSSSQNSQLTYEITCPAAEQTCNKNICDAALGSATAAAGIISPEIGGILGIIGPLECLICA